MDKDAKVEKAEREKEEMNPRRMPQYKGKIRGSRGGRKQRYKKRDVIVNWLVELTGWLTD